MTSIADLTLDEFVHALIAGDACEVNGRSEPFQLAPEDSRALLAF